MSAVNKVFILGNLGADPELRTTQNSQVCSFNVATSSKFEKDGEWKEETEWHKVVVWGKQAEHCDKYLAKGRTVHVEGRLKTRSWEDKDGVKRYVTEIIATSVQFIGGGEKKDSAPQVQQPAAGVATDDIPF